MITTCPACDAIISLDESQADEVRVCLQCGAPLPRPAEVVPDERDVDALVPLVEAVEPVVEDASVAEPAPERVPAEERPDLELPREERPLDKPFEMLPFSPPPEGPAPISASRLPAGKKAYPPPPPASTPGPPPFVPPPAPPAKLPPPKPATPPPFVPPAQAKADVPNINKTNPVKNYRILEADSAATLQTLVLEALDRGWQPQGGVSVGYSGASGKWWYYQAMVRGS